MNATLLEIVLIGTVLANLAILGSSRLATGIEVVRIQGLLLGFLPALLADSWYEARVLFLACAAIGLKCIVFPRILLRTMREADVRHEVQHSVGFSASIVAGVALLALSFWISSRLKLPMELPSQLLLPVSFSTILIGLLLIISRKTALSQVIGYLILENGIFVFGVSVAREEPLLVETGILLDIFAAVFVMGIAIFHISREFDTVEIERLSSLRD